MSWSRTLRLFPSDAGTFEPGVRGSFSVCVMKRRNGIVIFEVVPTLEESIDQGAGGGKKTTKTKAVTRA